MSGHSRWSTIKRKKSKEDAKKGKIFSKLIKAIIVAVKTGGPTPESNASLAQAIEKAKEYNLPNDKIESAIKKGSGDTEGVNYERIVYEGYAPFGVALLIDVLTDNRNRTAADIRHIFTKYDGSLGESGCVSWMFSKRGIVLLEKEEDFNEEELLSLVLEAGGEDLTIDNGSIEIVSSPEETEKIKKLITDHGYNVISSKITMFPASVIKLGKDEAKKVLRLVEALDEHDDVQEVFSNFDIPDEILNEIESGS